MKRHELTDEQWALVEPHVPVSTARTGRPPKDRLKAIQNSTARYDYPLLLQLVHPTTGIRESFALLDERHVDDSAELGGS